MCFGYKYGYWMWNFKNYKRQRKYRLKQFGACETREDFTGSQMEKLLKPRFSVSLPITSHLDTLKSAVRCGKDTWRWGDELKRKTGRRQTGIGTKEPEIPFKNEEREKGRNEARRKEQSSKNTSSRNTKMGFSVNLVCVVQCVLLPLIMQATKRFY